MRLLLAFLALALSLAAEPVILAEPGTMRAAIVAPAKADRLNNITVADLAGYLEKITGLRPGIRRIPPDALDATLAELRGAGQLPILVGIGHHDYTPDILARGSTPGAFALDITPAAIHLAGIGPEAICYAADELLERLGVRWFMAGPLGTVVPTADRLQLEPGLTIQVPTFSGRNVSGVGFDWSRHNRLGGVTPPSTLSFPAPAPFAEHPEYYALVDGERQPIQLCVSNPDVLRLEVEKARDYFRAHPDNLWFPVSNHGGRHCECAACRALDVPGAPTGPFTRGVDVSDRYIWFCNRILEELTPDFPDKRLAFTMATPHFWPPAKVKGHPRLDVLGWSVGFCRLHGPGNPVCPEYTMALGLIQQWVKALQGNYYERGNWGHVAGPGLPFPMVQRYRTLIPAYHAAGVFGFRTADYANWIAQNPSSYVSARLLWNADADVDAILADFYTRFYGPAEAPMRAWHELFERTMRDADYHSGTGIDFPHIYTPAMRQQARQLLRQAAQLAPEAPVKPRLDALALELDYLDAFCAMIGFRDRHHYAEAAAQLDLCRQRIDAIQAIQKPLLLGKSFARPYLDIFFGKAVDEAHRLTSTDGRLVAGLDDTWRFALDPRETGEADGWQRPGFDASAWRTLAGWTLSWSDQGLRNVEGVAWYRQTITLPATATGPLRLWFASVDEGARVWLNGQLLGDGPGQAWKSFDFDAAPAARPGQPNLLVVRTVNRTMDEIGTGGLTGPVFFYAPRQSQQNDQ